MKKRFAATVKHSSFCERGRQERNLQKPFGNRTAVFLYAAPTGGIDQDSEHFSQGFPIPGRQGVSETMRDTFETVAQFAELRHDVIKEFGRFPHRNASLGRANTSDEDFYLTY